LRGLLVPGGDGGAAVEGRLHRERPGVSQLRRSGESRLPGLHQEGVRGGGGPENHLISSSPRLVEQSKVEDVGYCDTCYSPAQSKANVKAIIVLY